MDLTNCDREPIHVPGAVQPHGVVFVCEAETKCIRAVGGDACRILDVEGEVIGRTLGSILDIPNFDWSGSPEPGHPQYLGRATAVDGRRMLDATAHVSGEWFIVELESIEPEGLSAAALLSTVTGTSQRLVSADSIEAACKTACRTVAELTGYDRAMAYQFLSDGSGKVVAEYVQAPLESLLNQHFPEADIPKQARELYRRNLIRVIPDVSYTPAPIVPGHIGEHLDLSDASLRSVSPVHIQYLKNMGVGASLSISISDGGQLWGLIACHNSTPKLVSFEQREACKQLAALLALKIGQIAGKEVTIKAAGLAAAREDFLLQISRAGNAQSALPSLLDQVAQLIPATGLIFVRRKEVGCWGAVPTAAQCAALAQWCRSNSDGGVFATDHLPELYPEAHQYANAVSGVLAVTVEASEPFMLIWCRQEYAHTVEWAGNPHKGDLSDAGALSPRKSFAVWREQVRGRSLPWEGPQVAAAQILKEQLEHICDRQEIAALQSELIFMSRVSAMGALAGSLAHELNQPLASIANYASALRQQLEAGSIDEEVLQTGVSGINSNALRAGRIIRSVRAMVSREEVQKQACDPRELIERAISLVGLDTTGVSVRTDYSHSSQVMADPVQIQQVLVNLFRNACEAMAGGDEQLLSIVTTELPDAVEFCVSDNGPGMPEELRDRVFEAFASTKDDGLGIGLSISRTIVEAHEGAISWEDGETAGAIFRFRLPLA